METLAEIRVNEIVEVEVLYLEQVLNSYGLQNRPWHAYHSAIGFNVSTSVNDDARGNVTENVYYTVDFSPRRVTTFAHPLIFKLLPYFLSEVPTLLWENDATVFTRRFRNDFSSNYVNRAKLGYLKPNKFEKLRDWIRSYAKEHVYFQPYEVRLLNKAGAETRWWASQTGHDFTSKVTNQLKQLVYRPFPETPEGLFRDTIVLYGSSASAVNISDTTTVRSLVKYFKSISQVNEDFAAARSLFETAEVAYMYAGGKYYAIQAVKPWVNHCYRLLHSEVNTRCLLH